MKNYIYYFKPGDKIPVLNSDGTQTGSEVTPPDIRNWYEYGKMFYDKAKSGLINYANVHDKLKEVNPTYYQNNPVPFWNKLFYSIADFVRKQNLPKRTV